MQVRKLKTKYSITNVFDLYKDEKKHVEFIKCFLEEDNILLFEYFKADPYYWDPEVIQEQRDSDYNMFINNFYEFHQQSTKEKVLKEIERILNEAATKSNQDDILRRFLEQELVLSEDVLDKIKDVIYIAVNTEEDPEFEKFVSNRKYISDNRLIKLGKKVHLKIEDKVSITWFKTETDEEIERAIHYNTFYTCAIVKRGDTLDDFQYILTLWEAATDYNIDVYVKNEGEFKAKVYPRIMECLRKSKLKET